MTELTRKWVDHELTREDVNEWVMDNADSVPLDLNDEENRNHVVQGLYKVYLYSWNEDTAGNFLWGVLTNNLFRVSFYADGVNGKALKLYPLFIYNVAPGKFSKAVRHGNGDEFDMEQYLNKLEAQ